MVPFRNAAKVDLETCSAPSCVELADGNQMGETDEKNPLRKTKTELKKIKIK